MSSVNSWSVVQDSAGNGYQVSDWENIYGQPSYNLPRLNMQRTTANGVVQEPLIGHPVSHNPYAMGNMQGNVSQSQPEAAVPPQTLPSFVQQPQQGHAMFGGQPGPPPTGNLNGPGQSANGNMNGPAQPTAEAGARQNPQANIDPGMDPHSALAALIQSATAT